VFVIFQPGSQNQATTEEPIVLPTTRDPNHSGALSGLGDIGFGYGISVAGVSVASKVTWAGRHYVTFLCSLALAKSGII
jgi:hypothetical protein